MEQQTFAEVSFESYRKPTRRELFLDRDMHLTQPAARGSVRGGE
jgi:hypothetical protein